MIELTVDDLFRLEDERERKLFNEPELLTELVKQERKIIDRLEEAVNNLPINEYFSIRRTSKANKTSEMKMKQYIIDWCKDHDKELFVYKGAKRGSIIKEMEGKR